MPYFAVDWTKRVDYDRIRSYRLKRFREQMVEANLDGVITFRSEHIRYITGFRPLWWVIAALGRNAAIMALEGDPILFPSSGDYSRAVATMYWLPSENIRPQATLEDHGLATNFVGSEYKKAFEQLGISSGRIGIDASNFHILEDLRRTFPDVEFVDANRCFFWAAAIKDDDEIAAMRISSKAADVGMQVGIKSVRSGIRECEVLGEVMKAFYSLGMEAPQANLIVTSGENTAPLHRFASDKLITENEFVFLDLGGCFNGMFAESSRTFIFGKPNRRQQEIYTTVYEMMMKCQETMKPGATNLEVSKTVREVIKEHNFDQEQGFLGILGHSIGIQAFAPPLIGEITAAGEEEYELQPGMIFSVEPGIYVPGTPGGGGVRLEDEILITEYGSEFLTKTSYDENLIL